MEEYKAMKHKMTMIEGLISNISYILGIKREEAELIRLQAEELSQVADNNMLNILELINFLAKSGIRYDTLRQATLNELTLMQLGIIVSGGSGYGRIQSDDSD